MEKSTIVAGAVVAGGLSLIYWLTRKESQSAQLRDADYENPLPGQSPPQDTTYYEAMNLAESDSMCGLPEDQPRRCGAFRPMPIGERRKFFHQPYGHWCYVPDPNSPFKAYEQSAHEQGQCERRLNSFSPSHWTEAQVDQAGKQLVC
jgi:hypothetical protein